MTSTCTCFCFSVVRGAHQQAVQWWVVQMLLLYCVCVFFVCVCVHKQFPSVAVHVCVHVRD